MTNNSKKFISSLSLVNFMGFGKTIQTINFGIPDKKAGSGLTLITGQSSTGKSTIIKALIGIKTTPMAIETCPTDQTLITVEYGGTKYTYTKGEKQFALGQWFEGDLAIEYKEYNKQCPFIIMNCRDYKHTYFDRDLDNIEATEYISRLIDVNTNNSYYYLPLLNYILNNKEYKDQFYELVQNIMPELNGELKIETGGLIDTTSKPGLCNLVYKTISGYKCLGSSLSDGWLSVLIISAKIILSNIKNCPIIIDEPELHLYPSAQKRLAKLLSIEAKEKQIILMTHSPYFVDWYNFFNNASFIRTGNRQGYFTVYSLKHKSKYRNLLEKVVDHWKRPHLFDLVTKEIFFSDKILFVEGQEDAGLIKNWLHNEYKRNQPEEYNYSFEIFGYGVNGVNNIPKFLDMVKDLGVKKVGVLTDKLVKDDDIQAIAEWKKNFNTECSYEFQELTTYDIRKKIKIDVDKLLEDHIDQETGKLKISDTIICDVNKCITFADSGYFDTKGKVIKCSNCKVTELLIDITKCVSSCKHASLIKIFDQFNEYFDEKADT